MGSLKPEILSVALDHEPLNPELLCENLEFCREHCNLTRYGLSLLAELAPGHFLTIMRRQTMPTAEVLIKLIRVLGATEVGDAMRIREFYPHYVPFPGLTLERILTERLGPKKEAEGDGPNSRLRSETP